MSITSPQPYPLQRSGLKQSRIQYPPQPQFYDPFYQQQQYAPYPPPPPQQPYPYNQYQQTYYTNNPQQQNQQQQLQPSRLQKNMNKSPIKQKSYLEIMQEFAQQYEQTHSIFTEKKSIKQGQSYSLYEDIKILIEMNKPDRKSVKSLAEQGIVNRSLESIKTRYNHYLKYLQNQDLDKLYSFLLENGIQGYMIFENNQEGEKEFKAVSLNDPKIQNIKDQQQQHKNRKINKGSLIKQYTGYNQDMSNLHLKQKPLHIVSSEQNLQDEIQEELDQIEQKSHKKKKLKKSTTKQQSQQIPSPNKKKQSVFKKLNILEQLNKEEKLDAEELDIVLTVIGNWLKMSKKELGQILHKCSGDLNLFDQYLNNFDKELLWEEQDDEILVKCLQEDNNNKNLQKNQQEAKQQDVPKELILFNKFKGGYSLKRRIQYLGLECHYDFVQEEE